MCADGGRVWDLLDAVVYGLREREGVGVIFIYLFIKGGFLF